MEPFSLELINTSYHRIYVCFMILWVLQCHHNIISAEGKNFVIRKHRSSVVGSENTTSTGANMAEQKFGSSHDLNVQTSTTSLALVPYDEGKITPFQQMEREFIFAGHKVVIKQQWGELGVAAVVWEAAISLCEYLSLHKSLVTNKTVIELGAGTGIVGIVAAKSGAKHVAVTDRKAALEQLQANVNLNLSPQQASKVAVQELDWGVNLESCNKNFDVVLGADIIYIEETFDLLLKTLLHLSNCKTLVILACRIRYNRDENFIGLLEEHFKLSKLHYNQRYDVQIYQASRKC